MIVNETSITNFISNIEFDPTTYVLSYLYHSPWDHNRLFFVDVFARADLISLSITIINNEGLELFPWLIPF